MKITHAGIRKTINTTIAAGALLLSPLALKSNSNVYHQQPVQDTFELRDSVPPSGTTSPFILNEAPDSKIKIQGETKHAVIVVDVSQNVLYKYDKNGEPECAYLVATGKPKTPTHKGVRIVTHTESYPYRNAPKTTKRYRTPKAFGPNTICLNKLDPVTGEQTQTGEFIHGNNDAKSIGTYDSNGCIRMDNEVIKIVSKQVKRGDIIVIK